MSVLLLVCPSPILHRVCDDDNSIYSNWYLHAMSYECHWSVFRYEKLAEQEEMNAQQQRRRLFAELQVERDKMAAQWDQQRREMDEQQAEAQVGGRLMALNKKVL